MGHDVNSTGGGSYYSVGNPEKARAEYKNFRAVIAQLLDDETLVGDVEGRWIVFKDSWVYGMATYPLKEDAIVFGKQMFRDEPDAAYIVVRVELDDHNINAMEVLASAMTDGPQIDLSTTPDEINRKSEPPSDD
jgi:hypothetical protein